MIAPPDSPFAKKPALRITMRLGPIAIEPISEGKVYLQHLVTGEAGEFRTEALARHLEEFFYREL